MANFPADSVRTKTWGEELLTSADLHTQFDVLHSYIQAALNSTTGHSHTGAANQGPKLSPANLVIASQAAGDTLYASSATAWARLAKGTAAQVLSMNAGATAPQWESAGTSANNLVRLDGDAKLPAVDGSLLTGVAAASLNGAILGNWVDKSGSYGAQQADTDGLVVTAFGGSDSNGYGTGYTDGNANPTTARRRASSSFAGAKSGFNMPVKKGDYWKVVSEGTGITITSVYWIPLGA